MSKREKDDRYSRSRNNSESDESRSRSNSRNNNRSKIGKISRSPRGSRSPQGNSRSRSPDNKDHDSLSVYIGNVDYATTEDELRDAFIDAGDIARVTIIKNMKTGHPKGAAFIEFSDKNGVDNALDMNGKHVKGRPLMVTIKKPRPEFRDRRDDNRGDRRDNGRFEDRYERNDRYERRAPPRSAPMYSGYQGGRGPEPRGGAPYGGAAMPRGGGYYPDPRDPYDGRRASHMSMQMDPPHMQPRYDPYRRPEFYDPYMMMPRGMQPYGYPSDPRKMNDPRGEPRGDPRGMDPRYSRDPRDARGDPRGDSRGYSRGEPRGDPRNESRGGEPRGDPRNHHRGSEQAYSSRR